VVGLGVGQKRGALRACGVERGGFELDALEISVLRRKAARCGDLAELAIAQREDGLRNDTAITSGLGRTAASAYAFANR